jgi:hypothetical protein
MIQQQKVLLALAQEQMQIVELEHRLVQAEAARGEVDCKAQLGSLGIRMLMNTVMRDHKIALFQAREDDLVAELADKEAEMGNLEVCFRVPLTLPEGGCRSCRRCS